MLTGMETANASSMTGPSLAEGAVMACGPPGAAGCLCPIGQPFYRQVLKNYFTTRDLILGDPSWEGTDRLEMENMLHDDLAAVVIQQPNFFGLLEEMEGVAEKIHDCGALLVVSVDPISLALCRTPAEYGADIVSGEGQGLGSPPSFGGPLLGFFAAKKELIRRMPGRIVGETVDREGKRGYVLTLQTREQHIRRERATSNICSNQALVALAAAVYLAALGPAGLRRVAELCLKKAAYARQRITALKGFEQVFSGPHFKEFAIRLPGSGHRLNSYLLEQNILGGLDLEPYYPELGPAMLLCVTETKSRAQIDTLVEKLEGWS